MRLQVIRRWLEYTADRPLLSQTTVLALDSRGEHKGFLNRCNGDQAFVVKCLADDDVLI